MNFKQWPWGLSILFGCLLSGLTYSQNSVVAYMASPSPQGINFEYGLSWDQVKAKAKAENKFIFVDCFATWCGPCKQMDKDIYTKEAIGNIVNEGFVSVKVQMDTSKNDNDQVKTWYADAALITTNYNIDAFPTLLFFSPDGNIKHKALGYKNPSEFTKLISDATNPDKQYYTLLKKYHSSEKNINDMLTLMEEARLLNDQSVLQEIGVDYTNNYLTRLDENKVMTQENIPFLYSYTHSSKEIGFNLFYKKGDKIDQIMGWKGVAKGLVRYIITKEEIDPQFERAKKSGGAPDWRMISDNITRKYSLTYAKELIASGKVSWYKWKKDWPNYSKWLVVQMEKYTDKFIKDSSFVFVNGWAWELFLHSKNKNELKIAVTRIKQINENFPATSFVVDTYANLLYKLGNVKEAIAMEEEAFVLAPGDDDIRATLAKMKSGKPTWTE